jgi:hypothetical protein
MIRSFKPVGQAPLFAAALLAAALPGIAHAAETSNGSGTAVLAVNAQCVVEGANVDLGTFTTTQTWGDVAAVLGRDPGLGDFIPGSRGTDYLNLGSITCTDGVQYELGISGSGSGDPLANEVQGGIKLVINGTSRFFELGIKRIGTQVLRDAYDNQPGFGYTLIEGNTAPGIGTGVPQELRGSAVLNTYLSSPTEPIGQAGTFSDSLVYTLTF